MATRRVVTGLNSDKKSIIVSDDIVSTVTSVAMPGAEFVPLWWLDSIPRLPLDGTAEKYTTFFPPAGGVRCGIITIPGASTAASPAAVGSGDESKLEGFLDVFEADNPGMHTTPSVDVDLVVSGELVLEVDEGIEVALSAGDVVVQNGTRHRWHNRGAEPATMVYFIVGADEL